MSQRTRHTLTRHDVIPSRLAWSTLVAAAVAGVIGASDGPGKKPGATAKPLPALNQKILDFARENVGKQVGDGECSTLAYEALKSAGARRYPWERSGDFLWGRSVATFREAMPGDVVQFRNAVFDGKRWVTKTRWVSWHYEYPHHTAVVAEIRDAGREVVLLHQNVHGAGDDSTPVKLVQEGSIRPESLQPGGKLCIYRPVAPDEDDAPATPSPEPSPKPNATRPRR
jgi:hypothetical protein